jgi:hypothetical protein
MMPDLYNNNVQVFQTHDSFVIYNEMVHNARIVPLDGRRHGVLRQWSGDSVGHWEGDTMIVDTIDFTDEGTGTLHLSPTIDQNTHLIERFRRTGPEALVYEFTVDDPSVWTRSWTARIPFAKIQSQLYEYACHEGNYSMANILSGARARDKAVADAGKKGAW